MITPTTRNAQTNIVRALKTALIRDGLRNARVQHINYCVRCAPNETRAHVQYEFGAPDIDAMRATDSRYRYAIPTGSNTIVPPIRGRVHRDRISLCYRYALPIRDPYGIEYHCATDTRYRYLILTGSE